MGFFTLKSKGEVIVQVDADHGVVGKNRQRIPTVSRITVIVNKDQACGDCADCEFCYQELEASKHLGVAAKDTALKLGSL